MKHSSASFSRGTAHRASLTLGPGLARGCHGPAQVLADTVQLCGMAKAPAQVGAAGKQGSLCAEEGRSLHHLQMQAWPWFWAATAKDYPDCKTAASKWRLQQRNMATLSRVRDIIKKMVILIRFAREGKSACILGLFCIHTYAKRKISLT